ncbi:GNAT family N-acetyltransferase [Cohnella sp. 56]|uniref:GNAT family N-acetyltransferase n=1 Tax=Cohnella sp. 56 TaxID=3113722 RepID=UPI0030E87D7B
MNLHFKRLDEQQAAPYELLLLADPNKELVDEYLSRGYCFLAMLENELVGEFVLIHTHPRTLEIVNIAVQEPFQGKGIGKALVLRAIEEARTMNAKTIEIGTGNSGFKQLKLYQRCGFRIVGVDIDFFIRNYDEELYEEGIQIKDMVRLRMEL